MRRIFRSKAFDEWTRVIGGDTNALFIITPYWWAPHTWLHPGHLFYATDGRGGTRGGRLIRIRKQFDPEVKKLTTLRGGIFLSDDGGADQFLPII